MSYTPFQKDTAVVTVLFRKPIIYLMGWNSSPVTLVTMRMEEKVVLVMSIYPELLRNRKAHLNVVVSSPCQRFSVKIKCYVDTGPYCT